ncbi:hypothetical protein D9M72_615250 [compost metagenome]
MGCFRSRCKGLAHGDAEIAIANLAVQRDKEFALFCKKLLPAVEEVDQIRCFNDVHDCTSTCKMLEEWGVCGSGNEWLQFFIQMQHGN